MDLPELALRFILEHPAVSTTIPGMRRPAHVERNLAASDGVAAAAPAAREALKTAIAGTVGTRTRGHLRRRLV